MFKPIQVKDVEFDADKVDEWLNQSTQHGRGSPSLDAHKFMGRPPKETMESQENSNPLIQKPQEEEGDLKQFERMSDRSKIEELKKLVGLLSQDHMQMLQTRGLKKFGHTSSQPPENSRQAVKPPANVPPKVPPNLTENPEIWAAENSRKLKWTEPLQEEEGAVVHQTSPEEEEIIGHVDPLYRVKRLLISSIRFDFEGHPHYRQSDDSEDLTGLRHHEQENAEKGYTIPEMVEFCLSKSVPQNVVGLQLLAKVWLAARPLKDVRDLEQDPLLREKVLELGKLEDPKRRPAFGLGWHPFFLYFLEEAKLFDLLVHFVWKDREKFFVPLLSLLEAFLNPRQVGSVVTDPILAAYRVFPAPRVRPSWKHAIATVLGTLEKPNEQDTEVLFWNVLYDFCITSMDHLFNDGNWVGLRRMVEIYAYLWENTLVGKAGNPISRAVPINTMYELVHASLECDTPDLGLAVLRACAAFPIRDLDPVNPRSVEVVPVIMKVLELVLDGPVMKEPTYLGPLYVCALQTLKFSSTFAQDLASLLGTHALDLPRLWGHHASSLVDAELFLQAWRYVQKDQPSELVLVTKVLEEASQKLLGAMEAPKTRGDLRLLKFWKKPGPPVEYQAEDPYFNELASHWGHYVPLKCALVDYSREGPDFDLTTLYFHPKSMIPPALPAPHEGWQLQCLDDSLREEIHPSTYLFHRNFGAVLPLAGQVLQLTRGPQLKDEDLRPWMDEPPKSDLGLEPEEFQRLVSEELDRLINLPTELTSSRIRIFLFILGISAACCRDLMGKPDFGPSGQFYGELMAKLAEMDAPELATKYYQCAGESPEFCMRFRSRRRTRQFDELALPHLKY